MPGSCLLFPYSHSHNRMGCELFIQGQSGERTRRKLFGGMRPLDPMTAICTGIGKKERRKLAFAQLLAFFVLFDDDGGVRLEETAQKSSIPFLYSSVMMERPFRHRREKQLPCKSEHAHWKGKRTRQDASDTVWQYR